MKKLKEDHYLEFEIHPEEKKEAKLDIQKRARKLSKSPKQNHLKEKLIFRESMSGHLPPILDYRNGDE